MPYTGVVLLTTVEAEVNKTIIEHEINKGQLLGIIMIEDVQGSDCQYIRN